MVECAGLENRCPVYRDRRFESCPFRYFNMYYVYIIRSIKTARYYVGCTGNLKTRIRAHTLGKTKSLRHEDPFKLVYTELYLSKHEAYKREQQIKRYKGGKAFKKLIQDEVSPT